MSGMTEEQWAEQVRLLDERLAVALSPEGTIARFVELIRYGRGPTMDEPGDFGAEHYTKLEEAQSIVRQYLPPILEAIRATSIDRESGWQFQSVAGSAGDHGLCAICSKPFQHFERTVKVRRVDRRSFYGVCRPCVRTHSPIAFKEVPEVKAWLGKGPWFSGEKELDSKRESQRVGLVDAIRAHLHADRYFAELAPHDAAEWARDASGEWR